jgi:hypothetical protein
VVRSEEAFPPLAAPPTEREVAVEPAATPAGAPDPNAAALLAGLLVLGNVAGHLALRRREGDG